MLSSRSIFRLRPIVTRITSSHRHPHPHPHPHSHSLLSLSSCSSSSSFPFSVPVRSFAVAKDKSKDAKDSKGKDAKSKTGKAAGGRRLTAAAEAIEAAYQAKQAQANTSEAQADRERMEKLLEHVFSQKYVEDRTQAQLDMDKEFAKNYSRMCMIRHRELKRAQTIAIKTKWEAIEALPFKLRQHALTTDFTEWPLYLRQPVDEAAPTGMTREEE